MQTLTPGNQALSVAFPSAKSGSTTNAQNGQVFQNSTTGPYTAQNAVNNGATIPGYNPQPSAPGSPNPQPSKFTPGSLGSFMEQVKASGGGLKEAQALFHKSIASGGTTITGTGFDGATPVSSQEIVNKLNAYFNGAQILQHTNRNQPSAPGIDPMQQVYGDIFPTNANPTLPTSPTAPATYSSVDEYQKMRDKYGIDALEAQINELSAQESEQIAITRKRIDTAKNSPVSLGVISGRASEIENQDSVRLADIQRAKSSLVNQLNTQNATIKMFMDFHKEDYTLASDRYKTQFDQAIKMQEIMRQKSQDAITAKDKEQDNYRAMYSTVYNGIANGSVNPGEFTPEMKAQFASLEMKAGLPVGFTEMIRNKNPKADIIYQGTTTDNEGNQTLNVVTRDANGKMSTTNLKVGKEGTKGRYQQKDDGTVFDTATGQSVTPVDNATIKGALKNTRETGQCGEGVNDYLVNLGDQRVFKDSWDQKKSQINSSSPVAGSIAIWNPGGATKENGHVGIVLEDLGDGVLIKDWNWKGDEKQMTHIVTKSSIAKTGGYYVSDKSQKSTSTPTNTKDADKLNSSLRDDASKLLAKINDDGKDFNGAHAELYTKYAGPLKSLGYSDEQVKLALHKLLGGQ